MRQAWALACLRRRWKDTESRSYPRTNNASTRMMGLSLSAWVGNPMAIVGPIAGARLGQGLPSSKLLGSSPGARPAAADLVAGSARTLAQVGFASIPALPRLARARSLYLSLVRPIL